MVWETAGGVSRRLGVVWGASGGVWGRPGLREGGRAKVKSDFVALPINLTTGLKGTRKTRTDIKGYNDVNR